MIIIIIMMLILYSHEIITIIVIIVIIVIIIVSTLIITAGASSSHSRKNKVRPVLSVQGKEDRLVGLDVAALLEDIRTGRGFKSVNALLQGVLTGQYYVVHLIT